MDHHTKHGMNMINTCNATTQVVREAMNIVSKDVRPPKVVREGKVHPKKYWYAIDTYECVLCGHTTIYKERVYDKKLKVHNYYQDACPQHFI